MKRLIITGAPGAGKTAIVRQPELDGFSVVEEAATDVIAAAHAEGKAEVWRDPSFIDAIAHLQKDRLIRAFRQRAGADPQRSDLPKPSFLLGFITPTEARRISFEDALRFERIHEGTNGTSALNRSQRSRGVRRSGPA